MRTITEWQVLIAKKLLILLSLYSFQKALHDNWPTFELSVAGLGKIHEYSDGGGNLAPEPKSEILNLMCISIKNIERNYIELSRAG